MSKPTGGMVFYPREYIIDNEDFTRHHAKGVDQQGQECVVYIQPSQQALQNAKNSTSGQKVPKLDDFGDRRPSAANACRAKPDNAPGNSEGILLVEQVRKDDELTKHFGVPAYVGGWASNLKSNSMFCEPLIGKGYFEASFWYSESDEAKQYRTEWEDINRRVLDGSITGDDLLAANQSMTELYTQYAEAHRVSFVGVIIHHEDIVTVKPKTGDELAEMMKPHFLSATKEGLYAGMIVRVRNGDVVDTNASAVCNGYYNAKTKSVVSADQVLAEFLEYNRKKIGTALSKGAELDLIPTTRANCGPVGNDRYKKEILPYGKLQKTFIDKAYHNSPGRVWQNESAHLFADVAIRLSEAKNLNKLLSSMHAYSYPRGNILSIDNSGEPKYRLDRDPVKEQEMSLAMG